MVLGSGYCQCHCQAVVCMIPQFVSSCEIRRCEPNRNSNANLNPNLKLDSRVPKEEKLCVGEGRYAKCESVKM